MNSVKTETMRIGKHINPEQITMWTSWEKQTTKSQKCKYENLDG